MKMHCRQCSLRATEVEDCTLINRLRWFAVFFLFIKSIDIKLVDIYVSFSLIAIHFWVCLKCVHVEGADMHARVWTSF